jgi:hypothetical protein
MCNAGVTKRLPARGSPSKNSTARQIQPLLGHVCARLNINDALTRHWNQNRISGIVMGDGERGTVNQGLLLV